MSSMTPLDENKILASVATQIISNTFKSIGDSLSGALRLAYDKIFEDFSPSIEKTYNKISRFRVICKRDEDVCFDDIYTPTTFVSSDRPYSDLEVVELLNEGAHIAIIGIGGAGKTLFMRYCWLTIFRNVSTKIPIYYELRNLNALTTIDLSTIIKLELSRNTIVSQDLFHFLCSAGRFVFLFDGFDEVKRELREVVEQQIHALRIQYPKCNIVVSSRNDLRFSGWQGFRVFETQPLTMHQTKDLLNKIPFDAGYKSSFINKIDNNFFNRNKSFLSTPLLAIIMMMTFRENVDTPNKMSIFYQQAFLTLYHMHDATKMYSREKCLDLNDFQDALSVFCLLTYSAEKFSLTENEALSFSSNALEASGKSTSSARFLTDLIESVNIMKREGFDISFIHRSFQEYFCANALVKLFPSKIYDFTMNFGSRNSDNVLSLCYEMNRHLYMSEVVARRASELNDLFDALKSTSRFPLLTTIGARFTFHVLPQKKKGQTYLTLVGGMISTSDPAYDFFTIINSIINPRSQHGLPPIVRCAVDSGIFDIFRSKETSLDTQDGSSYISFRIRDDKVIVSAEDLSIIDNMPIENIKVRGISIKGTISIFEKTESKLRQLTQETEQWLTREIESASKQTKFLDGLLK